MSLADLGITSKAVLAGDVLVGSISCFPMDGQDYVGYWIDRAYWGMGIASRALHLLLWEVAKRPLFAAAATSNGASLQVLQKCGFVIEQLRLAPASERYPECEEAASGLALLSAPPGASLARQRRPCKKPCVRRGDRRFPFRRMAAESFPLLVSSALGRQKRTPTKSQ